MLSSLARLCVALAAAAALVPATAAASWGHPNSAVSGGMLVRWTSDSGEASDPTATMSHGEGTVRYTILGRALGAGVPQAWVPGEFPSWARSGAGNGFFLRARVAVEHFAASARTRCDNGQFAEVTSRVTATPQEHALLMTEEPSLDLIGGRGTVDLDLPFLVHRDGVIRLGQVVIGTGMITLTTTGTICSTDENGLPAVVAQDPSVVTEPIADLMGGKVVSAIDDGYQHMGTTVRAGGAFDLAPKTRRLLNDTGFEAYLTIGGSFTPELHVGGPPAASSSECTVPTFKEVERMRTLAGVQQLVRRHGFMRAFVAPGRAAIPRQDGSSRFVLDFGASTWICGTALGSRRFPVLVPLRR